jgi:RNA polymerase sigma-70 factor (ECF subfamily)
MEDEDRQRRAGGWMDDWSKDERSRWIRAAIQKHETDLIRYAFRMTGDMDRARDIVQDTFLQLCRKQPPGIRDHLVQWLFTVCRNRALDVLKKESRMTPLSEAGTELLPSRDTDPARLAEVRDSSRRILLLLEQLPERHQEVVRLKFQNDLSYREISQITRLSISNVGFILHTSLKKIRCQLEEETSATGRQIRRIK